MPKNMTYAEWKAKQDAQIEESAPKPLDLVPESDKINIEEPKRSSFVRFQEGESVNQFFYYDDYEQSHGLIAKKNSKYSKWMKELSEDERSYILDYTAGGYGDINDYLRKRNSWESINADRVKEATEYLDTAIDKFVLKDSIIVQRGVMDDALDNIINQYGIEDNAQLIGKVFHDNGYVSTTALSGNSVATTKPVLFEISVPAGRGRGAYVNELSGFTDAEYEFLLKRDSDYTITDVTEDEERGQMIVKMVMNIV